LNGEVNYIKNIPLTVKKKSLEGLNL